MKFDESLNTENTTAEVLKEVKHKVDNLYRLKQLADKAEKEYKDAKNELSKIMEESEIDKIQGDECSVSLQLKSSATVPKDPKDKESLFNYIKENYNDTVLQDMLTINARTFSSWVTAELDKLVTNGIIEPKIPGVNPYEYYSLGMRKRSKK